MKKIKQLMGIGLVIMALCACTAKKGTVEGNYKEPMEQELETAMQTVNAETLFGDPTKEDWHYTTEFDFSMDFAYKFSGQEMKVSADLAYQLELTDPDSASVKGKGDLGIEFQVKENGKTEKDKASGTLYNDSDYFYFNSQDEKMKISFESLFSSFPIGLAENEETQLDAQALLDYCDQYHLTLGLDTKNGLKMKLSASKKTLTSFLNEMDPTIAQIAFYMDTFVADFYIHINQDGILEAIAATINCSLNQEGMELSLNMTFDADLTNRTVTLPNDLISYPEIDSIF